MADERYRAALSGHGAGDAAAAAREQQLLAMADEELAHLAVTEPRPGFESRLRAAVYEAMSARARRPIWLWPAVGIAATLVLALVLLIVLHPVRETAAMAETSAVSLPAPGSAPAPAHTQVVASPRHRSVTHRKPVEPEVLIPPGEAQALRDWLAQVNREQRVPALLASTDTAADQRITFTNIEIQPIEIVPLEPATSSGT